MVTAAAWVAILITSNLTTIGWRLLLHRDVPLWTLGVRIRILLGFAVFSSVSPTLRPLRLYAKAVALCEESLAMFQTLGGKRAIAYALRLTGHAVRLLGDLERAAGLYWESLAILGEAGDKWVTTECIEGLAIIASAQGNPERAARLFGVAEAARETFGITMPRPERGDHERFGATTRERLGDAAFATAWAEGRAMTLEQAIEYALAGESNDSSLPRRGASEADLTAEP